MNPFRRGGRFIWVGKLADGSTFGPHTGHVVTYVPFVEGMRKIVLAVKAAVMPYFIMIGGTGSTILESEGVNCCDSRNFWVKVPLRIFLSFAFLSVELPSLVFS